MKLVRHSISALITALAIAPATVSAQSLSKEITVDRDIVLTHREANRLTTLPRVTLPALERPNLSFANYTASSDITNDLETLPPVNYDIKLPADPYRGYIMAGYFPLQRVNLSAGYRIIDTRRVQLSAWLQYNRDQYKSRYSAPTISLMPMDVLPTSRFTLKSNSVAVGTDLTLATGKNSALEASAAYNYSRHLFPALPEIGSQSLDMSHIGANQVNISVGYRGKSESLAYHVGGAMDHFAYTGESMPQFTFNQPKPRETSGSISAGVSHALSSLTLCIDADYTYTSGNSDFRYREFIPGSSSIGSVVPADVLAYTPVTNDYSADYGILKLHPYVAFKSDKFSGDAGLNLEFTHNQGSVFHPSPEINLGWTPVNLLTVGLKATGGVVRNTLSSLYALTPWQFAGIAYENSYIPVDATLSVIAGPHRSLWGRVSVGFSSARGWLMPFYSGAATVWSPCDISGWRFEAAAGYSWRGIIDVQASVAMAPQKVDRGYYLWRDRAGIVADLSLALHPLRPLIVKADWQIRALRHGSVMFTDAKIAILGSDVFHALYPINNVSDLSLSASWQFTPAFSVWAEGTNLLNRHCDTFTPFTSQGRTAMAGVTWRF